MNDLNSYMHLKDSLPIPGKPVIGMTYHKNDNHL